MHIKCTLLCLLVVLINYSTQQEQNDISSQIKGLWPVIPVFQKLANSSKDECSEHSQKLLQALNNSTLWAVQMVDASGRMPAGLLSGNIYSLGDFDECMNVVGPVVRGKYCLATLHLHGPGPHRTKPRPVFDAHVIPDPLSSAWRVIESGGERWRAPRDVVHMGLCMPVSCSAAHVEVAAQEALAVQAKLIGATVEAVVSPATCSVQNSPIFTTADIIFCCTLGILLILVVGSTLYDLIAIQFYEEIQPKCFTSRLLLCFAARKHFVGLGRVAAGEDELNFLFGLRLISILLVILCHKIGFTSAGPFKNPSFAEKAFSQWDRIPILHGDLVVDTFFFLAGFLLTVGLTKALNKPKGLPYTAMWPLYIFRYMRLTPAYLLTIFFYATLLPKLGSGPLWQAAVTPEMQYCTNNWWTNALYINNYVNVETMCIEQSWYMPCDMHMFFICVPLVMLIFKRPRWGYSILAALCIGTIVAPFLTIYLMDTDSMLLFFFDFIRGSRVHPYFASLYVKSHVRASPYFVGLIFGLIYFKIGDKTISMMKSMPLLLAGVVLGTATSFSAAFFYNLEGPLATSLVTRAIYGSMHRAVWAVALGCFVLATTAGKLSLIKAVLAWRPLVPLSKLSYGAYLIHAVVIWYSAGGVREPAYSNSYILVLKTWGDTVATFILALILYLLVEAPIRDVTKLLLMLGGKNHVQEEDIQQENTVVSKKTIVYSL